MKASDDLLNLADVCNYFGLSESTIRRKVKDSREGIGNFPLPLFGSKCRVIWRKSDIESWRGEDGEIINFIPSLNQPKPQVVQSSAKVRKELEKLGVKLPTHKSNQPQ